MNYLVLIVSGVTMLDWIFQSPRLMREWWNRGVTSAKMNLGCSRSYHFHWIASVGIQLYIMWNQDIIGWNAIALLFFFCIFFLPFSGEEACILLWECSLPSIRWEEWETELWESDQDGEGTSLLGGTVPLVYYRISVESQSPTPGFAGVTRGVFLGLNCENRYFSTNFWVNEGPIAGVRTKVGGVAQHCTGYGSW